MLSIDELSFTKTVTKKRKQNVTFSSILLTSIGQEYIYCPYNCLIRLYSNVVGFFSLCEYNRMHLQLALY
jgi:hypothetical protein